MSNLACLLIFPSFFLGCSNQYYYSTKSTYDEFNQQEHTYMVYNRLDGAEGTLDLNLHRIKRPNGEVRFYLEVSYTNNDWLFIEEGKSLVLLIDGKKHELEGEGSQRYREVVLVLTYGSIINERADYDCPDVVLIHSIANASIVKVRLIGSSYYSDHQLTAKNKKNFSDFLARYSK